MTILRNNLKRLFKRKGLIFIMLFPIIFTAFFLMSSGELDYSVGIIDEDNTTTSQWLLEDILESSKFEYLSDSNPDKIEEQILTDAFDFVIVIPKDYEARLLTDNNLNVETYFSKGNAIAAIPQNNFNGKVELLSRLPSLVSDKEALHVMLEKYSVGVLTINTRTLGENNQTRQVTARGIGILVMSMLYFARSSGGKMSDDKENGIYQRTMASPISRRRYALESITSLFIMSAVNVIAVMAVISLALGGDFGPNPINVLLVLLVFALVAVALSNLISTISKDRRQANTINVMITTPLCMLGGCFWPIDITPKVMQYISNFTPTKWVIDAVAKTTAGGGLDTVLIELVILLLFAFAIFAISTGKRIAWSK